MKRSILALLWLLVAHAVAAQTLPPAARAVIERVATIESAHVGELPALGAEAARVLADHPLVIRVPVGGDLLAALEQAAVTGLPIEIEDGAVFTGRYRPAANTTIRMLGTARIVGITGGPALDLNASGIRILGNLEIVSSPNRVAVLCGRNDSTQTTVASVPRDIEIVGLRVPTHRGARAIEINCIGRFSDLFVADTYDTAGGDSQAVAVLNTPGPVLIEGRAARASLSAGSEVVLVAGDTMKIAGPVVQRVTLRNLLLHRPLSWKTDGVRRNVKALLQFKGGEESLVQDVIMDGAWEDPRGQVGHAVSITPRNSMWTRNIVFDTITIRNAGSGFQVTGRNDVAGSVTPHRTTGILVRNSCVTTDHVALGGHGVLAILTLGVGTIDFENVVAKVSGTRLIYGGDGERIERIRMVDSLATVGRYGIMGGSPGQANLANWATWVDTLDVQRNVFLGAVTALQRAIPLNSYVGTAGEFDAALGGRCS
jgi:hypothetical protein